MRKGVISVRLGKNRSYAIYKYALRKFTTVYVGILPEMIHISAIKRFRQYREVYRRVVHGPRSPVSSLNACFPDLMPLKRLRPSCSRSVSWFVTVLLPWWPSRSHHVLMRSLLYMILYNISRDECYPNTRMVSYRSWPSLGNRNSIKQSYLCDGQCGLTNYLNRSIK